jgi:tRNA-specific 2-thiouridylase
VIGMMMRLWSEPGAETSNRCCTPDAMAQARRVAALLSIPFYAVDAQDVFHETVVNYFISGYTQGGTPNPCLVCNRQIRWEFLLQRALALGATQMATGHYARVSSSVDGKHQLLRAVDNNKDQSYILHVLSQEKLAHAIFPLGEYTKPQVRDLARSFNLPVAERPESQDLCFLGDDGYRAFLQRNAPSTLRPGDIVRPDGSLLGQHLGLALYTIGQRKGLGISAQAPLFVLEKDIQNNRLVVGELSDLGRDELLAGQINWIDGEIPQEPFKAHVKIRYKSREVQVDATPQPDGCIYVKFDEPMRDITPGQAVVFYQEDVCLGGGIIL